MFKKGPKSKAPGGYGTITPKGYRRLWDAHQKRYRMEHVLIWESFNGTIPRGHYIHHRNGNKLDNRLKNLELLTALAHKRIHSGCIFTNKEWWKPCTKCGIFRRVSHYYKRHDGISSRCRPCMIMLAVQDKKNRRARIATGKKAEIVDGK